MEQKVTVGDRVIISGLTIMPVIETRVSSWQNKIGSTVFCSIRPLFILVSAAGYPLKAFHTDGTETTLDAIREKYPGLQIPLDT